MQRLPRLLLLASPVALLLAVLLSLPVLADNCDLTNNPGDCGNTAWTIGSIATLTAAATGTAIAGGFLNGKPKDEHQRLFESWRQGHPYSPATDFQEWWDQTHGGDGSQRGFFGNFWDSYVQDAGSGEQLLRLISLPADIRDGFIGAARSTWDMIANAPQMIGVAADFYLHASAEQVASAYQQFGQSMVDQFNDGMHQLQDAVAAHDNDAISKIIGNLSGNLMFQAVLAKGPGEAWSAVRKGMAGSDAVASGTNLLKAPAGTVVTDISQFGMTSDAAAEAQSIADKYGVRIQFRPTTEDAPGLVEEGAYRKPEAIKCKTINQYDTQLGARTEDVGKVGYFEPKEPPFPRGTTPEAAAKYGVSDPDKVWARFDERAAEFEDQKGHMAELQSDGAKVRQYGGKMDLKVTVDENGVVRDAADGRPFTGDHDLFKIVNQDGSPVSRATKAAVLRDLQHGVDVKHADISTWRPDTDVNQGIKNKIMQSHAPGGNGVVEFAPGGPPTVQYGDPVPSAAAPDVTSPEPDPGTPPE
jgi:hypothetical protein